MTVTFSNTRNALLVFDAGHNAREKAWQDVETDADVDKAEGEDRLALALVQMAFHEDTKAYNRLSNCFLVGEKTLRRMVNESKEVTQQ